MLKTPNTTPNPSMAQPPLGTKTWWTSCCRLQRRGKARPGRQRPSWQRAAQLALHLQQMHDRCFFGLADIPLKVTDKQFDPKGCSSPVCQALDP